MYARRVGHLHGNRATGTFIVLAALWVTAPHARADPPAGPSETAHSAVPDQLIDAWRADDWGLAAFVSTVCVLDVPFRWQRWVASLGRF